jgi:hypothetical protein
MHKLFYFHLKKIKYKNVLKKLVYIIFLFKKQIFDQLRNTSQVSCISSDFTLNHFTILLAHNILNYDF